MNRLKNWNICWLLIVDAIQSVSAIQQLIIHTKPQYLAVSWHSPAVTPSRWNLVYSVPGTGYHSNLSLRGTSNEVNITTTEYPGVLYAIQLFARNNGSSALVGWGNARADCSHTAEISVGDTYTVVSPGYPNSPLRGQICTWSVIGSNQTWYRFTINAIDISDGKSCDNYLQIQDKTICDNGSFHGALVLHNNSVDIKFVHVQDFGGKGFNISISGIWKIGVPENLTTILSDDIISVSWQEPLDCPPEISFVLRVSHYPHTTHQDIAIPGNITNHQVNVTSHAGQNFTFKVKAVNDDSSGEFSDPITVQTNCDENIYIRQLQTLTLTSKQYPFHYLAGIHCHFNIRTGDDNYLKVAVTTMDISGGSECSSAYLEIGVLGKFCSDSPPPASAVIQASNVSLNFVTGATVQGKGFQITVKSVERPPSPPLNLVTRTANGKIILDWSPPTSRNLYLNGYIVHVSVGSDSNFASLSVSRNSTSIIIPTKENQGRLFIFRVQATSEGGKSENSKPHYARALCGSSFQLARLTSAFISSPLDKTHKYQSGVVCQWTISTSSPLWLRVEFAKFDIEFSENCSKDSIEFSSSNLGKVCGNNITGVSRVVRQPKINITFSTDYSIEFSGFVLKVTSVGPAPLKPNNVQVLPSEYCLIVSWEPPPTHRSFVTGYLIHYRIYGNTTVVTERLISQERSHAIDTTNWPGSLYEIWVQTHGDIEGGGSSDIVTAHAACGQNITLRDERIYITSPHYPYKYSPNVRCQWSLANTGNTSLTLTFMKIDLKNTLNNCTDNITISDFGVICDDAMEASDIVLDPTTLVSITFQSDGLYEGSGFMLAVAKSYSISSVQAASRSRHVSSSLQLQPSPANVFSISATSLVLTTVITGDTIIHSDETLPDKTVQMLMPSFSPKVLPSTYPLRSSLASFTLKTIAQSTPPFLTLNISSEMMNPEILLSTYHSHISGTEVHQPDKISIKPTSASLLLHLSNASRSDVITTLQREHGTYLDTGINTKHVNSYNSSKFKALTSSRTMSDENTSSMLVSKVATSSKSVYGSVVVSGDTEIETKYHVKHLDSLFVQASKIATNSSSNSMNEIPLKEISKLVSAHNIMNASSTLKFVSRASSINLTYRPFSKILTTASKLHITPTATLGVTTLKPTLQNSSLTPRRVDGNAASNYMLRPYSVILVISMYFVVHSGIIS